MYKNTSQWGRDKARKYADGGDVAPATKRYIGGIKLRNDMAGPPPPFGFRVPRSEQEYKDQMRGQMERSKEISNAVPRKGED